MTFTIDVPIGTEGGGDEDPCPASFDVLRAAHESIVENLVPEDDALGYGTSDLTTDLPSSLSSGRAFFPASTRPTSSTPRTTHAFSSVQPQFNLESATSLLVSFREGMLPYFPVIVLPPDASVPTLARERPFVLLAILAAASAGGSLQGHNLYNDEFCKVLGLKVVSSGERSVELLAGLLIYCAWFPLHLRPRNKQVLHYTRLAIDIVRDLELDQAEDGIDSADTRANGPRMASIRAYLAAQLLCSRPAASWTNKAQLLPFDHWTATCCKMLAGPASAVSDQTLAWHVRLQHIMTQTVQLHRRGGRNYTEDGEHAMLLLKGMEAQFHEFQARMSAAISSQPMIRLATLATALFLHGASLLHLLPEQSKRRAPSNAPHTSAAAAFDPIRLATCAIHLRTWFDTILAQPTCEFLRFHGLVWEYIVTSVVLGLRLSFPIPPSNSNNTTNNNNNDNGWDHALARRTFDFGNFLAQFADIGGTTHSTTTDVLSASKVVMAVVRRKYEKRLAALERAEEAAALEQPARVDKGLYTCPVLDGSLDQYIQEWDASVFGNSLHYFASAPPATETGMGCEQPGAGPGAAYDDLWAAMTTEWTQDGLFDREFDESL